MIGIRGDSSEVLPPPLGAKVGSLCLPQATLPPQPLPHRGTRQCSRLGNSTGSSPVNAESWNGSILAWKGPSSSPLMSSAHAGSPEFGTCSLQRLGAPCPHICLCQEQASEPLLQGVSSAGMQGSHPIILMVKSAARQRQAKLYPPHNFWEDQSRRAKRSLGY